MAGQLTNCVQCRSEVHVDDRFCQECGASLPAPPAVLTCLNCGSRHDVPSKYCGSCGSLMSEMGVMTTPVPAVTGGAGQESRKPFPSQAPDRQTSSRQSLFQSPVVQRAVNPGVPQAKSQAQPTYSYSRPIVDLSIGILLLTFFGLLVWWLVDSEQSKSPFSYKEALIQAKGAVGANRLDEAVYIMEKVSLSKNNQLSPEERVLFDEALYQRSQSFAQKKNYRLALSDLLRISPAFAQYDAARKQIKEYSGLAQAEVQRLAKEADLSSAKKSAEDKKPDTTQAAPQGAIQAPSQQVAARQKGDAASGGDLAPAEGSVEADVVQYNKLLADYFTGERMNTRRQIKEGLGVSADNGEPPSFKEWLEAGKPDF